MINCLTNLQPSVLSNKWRFNISQDWEVLGDDINSISLDTILNNILQTLDFYHFPLDYLEKRVLQFVDVTDKLELAIELKDNSQPITNSKDEKTRKKLEHAAKKKAWCNNLYTFM